MVIYIKNFLLLILKMNLTLKEYKQIIGLIKKNKFPSLKTKEDFVFWLRYLDLGYKINAFNKCLTFWYQTKGSLSSDLFQKIFDGYRVYRNYMNFGIIKSLVYLFLLSKNYLIKDL